MPGVVVNNEELAEMGRFNADNTSLVGIANHLVSAQKLLDRAGYR